MYIVDQKLNFLLEMYFQFLKFQKELSFVMLKIKKEIQVNLLVHPVRMQQLLVKVKMALQLDSNYQVELEKQLILMLEQWLALSVAEDEMKSQY